MSRVCCDAAHGLRVDVVAVDSAQTNVVFDVDDPFVPVKGTVEIVLHVVGNVAETEGTGLLADVPS